jgi:hypothetical protein
VFLFYLLMATSGFLSYLLGYRGLVLIPIVIFGSVSVFVTGVSVLYFIRPPKVELLLRYGDTGLRLGNIPERAEDPNRDARKAD